MTSRFNPHPTRRLGARLSRFQSSPNPKVGCHQRCRHWLRKRFHRYDVSILTQPEGWVPCTRRKDLRLTLPVSILTQPEGWVPSQSPVQLGLAGNWFQSSPNPKVGCHTPIRTWRSFNPHPPKVGCHNGWSQLPSAQFQSSPNPKVGCHQA